MFTLVQILLINIPICIIGYHVLDVMGFVTHPRVKKEKKEKANEYYA